MKCWQLPPRMSHGSAWRAVMTIFIGAMLLSLFGMNTITAAQTPAQPTADGATSSDSLQGSGARESSSTWDRFSGFLASSVKGPAGTVFLVCILLVSAFSMAIICERLYYLYFRFGKRARRLVGQIVSDVDRGRVDDARFAARASKTPLGPILYTLLDATSDASGNRSEIAEIVEEQSAKEAANLRRGLTHLHMLANVATLLGLLGTIVGLILAFSVLASLPAAQRAQQLTHSISLAMGTTAFGLIVAIPNLVFHSILTTAAVDRMNLLQDAISRIGRVLGSGRRQGVETAL